MLIAHLLAVVLRVAFAQGQLSLKSAMEDAVSAMLNQTILLLKHLPAEAELRTLKLKQARQLLPLSQRRLRVMELAMELESNSLLAHVPQTPTVLPVAADLIPESVQVRN